MRLRDTWAAVLCIAVVLASIAFTVLASLNSTSEFRLVCEQSGGRALWDGRQWQCLKPTKESAS